MNTTVTLAHELAVLLERVLLTDFRPRQEDNVQSDVWDSAIRHGIRLLGAKDELLASELFQLKLRLAMHFAPVAAIAYDAANPRPRHLLVRDYLKEAFQREGPASERLARDVAAVLDRWDTARQRVTDIVDSLRARQGNRCAHCGFLFNPCTTPRSVDEFKPYHDSPDELTAPEVDHIDPISGFGTNRLENLHAICRLCNAGKGEGLGIDVKREILFAAIPVAQIPVPDRIRMLYYVIERDGRKCSLSGKTSREAELTIRFIRPRGGFVRTNLHAVTTASCYKQA